MSRAFKRYLIGLFTLVVSGVTGLVLYSNHINDVYTLSVINASIVRVDNVVIRSDAGVWQVGSLAPGETRSRKLRVELNTTRWTYQSPGNPSQKTGEEWFNHGDVGDGDAVIEIGPEKVVMYGKPSDQARPTISSAR